MDDIVESCHRSHDRMVHEPPGDGCSNTILVSEVIPAGQEYLLTAVRHAARDTSIPAAPITFHRHGARRAVQHQ
jgi:hypothetical protein